MDFLRSRWVLLVVAFGLAAVAPMLLRKKRAVRHATQAALLTVALWGAWAHTDFGFFHGNRGNFHVHDFFHYYVGTKYLKELGYYGLYLGTTQALAENTNGRLRIRRMRDLRKGANFLESADEIRDLSATYRARFTDERWAAFKSDIRFLYDRVPDQGFWQKLVLDAGFNPPPTFALPAHVLSNAVALSPGRTPWLASIDLLLLAAGASAVLWAFGPTAAMLFAAVVGNAPVRTYTWTGGSFLRHAWLFALVLGVALLARRRYRGAGAALGTSAAFVFFPFVFVGGAMVPLAWRTFVTRLPDRLRKFLLGMAATLLGLGVLTLIVFGPVPWAEWFSRITSHDASFFTNHIGWKKVTTFVPEAARQNFGVGNTLFTEWNQALAARAAQTKLIDRALQVTVSLALLWSVRRARPAVAATLVGAAFLILWTTPASYYTTFCALVVATMVVPSWRNPFRAGRFVAVAIFALGAQWLESHERDLIVQTVELTWLWLGAFAVMGVCTALDGRRGPRAPVAVVARVLAGTAVALGALALVFRARFAEAQPADLPAAERKDGTVSDYVQFGDALSQAGHGVEGETRGSVERRYMDMYGARVTDMCIMLPSEGDLRYTLTKKGDGPARIVVRTDSFYAGELHTTINDAPVPGVRLDPRQTMFGYVTVVVPSMPPGTLRVRHTTSAKDIGMFTLWLVED
jgi:hypothetical protein